jgi:hypothetical protein
MTAKGHGRALLPPKASGRCRIDQETLAGVSGGHGIAPIADHRSTIATEAKRCLSARRGESTADVASAGYAKARFAVAQNAQDSNRGVDTAGNLVNVG